MAQTRVAVAATGGQAMRAGIGTAGSGGNAVDAALAAALVSLSTEPGMVSLAGGCFLSIWPAHGEPLVIDGNVEMPGRGLPAERFGAGVREVVTDYGGGVTMHAGPGSVATPGIIPAFALAHEHFARLDWVRLVAPAVHATRNGYPMSPAAARYLGYAAESLFGTDPEAHSVVTRPDGSLLHGGEPTRNLALSEVLEQLAIEGAPLFTTGAVGSALADQMALLGGLITAEDLAAYRPEVREPSRIQVGDWQVAANPPPSVGGPMLAVMLGELSRRGRWTWADAIEIQRAVLGYRTEVHDFAADLGEAGDQLLATVAEHGIAALRGSSSTVHVSAVDSEGTACAITMSSGYGAGLCIPGTGILLNNTLGEVELNRRGLHAIEPGTRLMSNMAPTTARGVDGRALAIGSPGADRITTALMLVLGHAFAHHTDLQTAIDLPRVHVRYPEQGPPTIEHEPDAALAGAAAATGLPVRVTAGPDMYFGGVGACLRRADGSLMAAADGRREAAIGVSER